MTTFNSKFWPHTTWDDAFANMAYIPESDTLIERWVSDAADFRDTGFRTDIAMPYGDSARETLDLIWPDTPAKGLAVFVHGGYWKATDPSFWSHYAEGARAQGWVVCLPGYTLAPQARISEMTRQIARAITHAADLIPGPIRLAGHSAGGHLVSRMCCDDSPLSHKTWSRVAHTVSISGLHDLRPLMMTEMNETLGLDHQEAEKESAVLHAPRTGTAITTWVGGGERPEFQRQAQMLDLVWKGLQIQSKYVIDGEHDHFSVLEGLRDPHSTITQAFVG